MMERQQILATMGELKLFGMKSAFDEIINRAPNRHAPYVGLSAFATKAGIHASAILKDPRTYEHVGPERVGNRRRPRIDLQPEKLMWTDRQPFGLQPLLQVGNGGLSLFNGAAQAGEQ